MTLCCLLSQCDYSIHRKQYTTANELACDADPILHDTGSEGGDDICVDEEDSGAEDSVSYCIKVLTSPSHK